MRPNIPTIKEVTLFFKNANEEEKKQLSVSLFETVDEFIIAPPLNQHALVLHTLIFPPQFEISGNYWCNKYKSMKFSTRLGELEKKLNTVLVKREFKPFINRFGHSSSYVIYIPILEQKDYVELYKKINI